MCTFVLRRAPCCQVGNFSCMHLCSQVCTWWEENKGNLAAKLSRIGSRHKQVIFITLYRGCTIPLFGSKARFKNYLPKAKGHMWYPNDARFCSLVTNRHYIIFIRKVQGITWKLEAVPGCLVLIWWTPLWQKHIETNKSGRRVLIYTITVNLNDSTRAPIVFTCSPQVACSEIASDRPGLKGVGVYYFFQTGCFKSGD